MTAHPIEPTSRLFVQPFMTTDGKRAGDAPQRQAS